MIQGKETVFVCQGIFRRGRRVKFTSETLARSATFRLDATKPRSRATGLARMPKNRHYADILAQIHFDIVLRTLIFGAYPLDIM
jgi:hypothetical protein